MKTTFLSATLLFLSCCIFAQQPGTVDPSFGTKGKVLFTYGTDRYFSCIGGAVQKDDKIIAVGDYSDLVARYPTFSFVRFLPDGTLDTSFGDSGRADVSLKLDYVQALSMLQQPDGKIVVAGYGYNYALHPVYYGLIVRVNPDGTPDKGFGDNGVVRNNYTKDIIFYSVNLAPDNKIVAAGMSSSFSSVISRYLPDGTPDASFGNGGNAELSGANVFASTVQPDGKIIVGGANAIGDIATKFLLARYLSNGSLDESFGTGGVVKTAYGKLTDQFRRLAVQKDNRILAAGSTSDDYLPVILRYNENGTVDSSFGTNGAVETIYNDTSYGMSSISLQPDGRLLLPGGAAKEFTVNSADFSLFQLNTDGSLDSSFATDGKTVTDMGKGIIDISGNAAPQSDGKLVLIGTSIELSDTASQVLYISLLRCYGEKGQKPIVIKIKRFLQHHGITWQTDNNARYYTVQRSLDGGVTYQPLAKLYNNHQAALTYEDASAMSEDAVYRVAVVAKDGARSLSNSVALTNEAGVRVYPNPVRSTLQVQGLPQSKSSLNITDFSGNVRTSVVASGGTASLNTSTLKPGNYLLKVQNGNTVETKAFVKE